MEPIYCHKCATEIDYTNYAMVRVMRRGVNNNESDNPAFYVCKGCANMIDGVVIETAND